MPDGNGALLLALDGYEELTGRVPGEYCRLILSPAAAYLTQPLAAACGLSNRLCRRAAPAQGVDACRLPECISEMRNGAIAAAFRDG